MNLGSLELYDNQVSDISALSGLINLSWLWLNYNQISDVSALANLTNVVGNVYLHYNNIVDIEGQESQCPFC